MSYRDVQRRSQGPGFFWTPADHVVDDLVTLIGDEAKHAFTVCRIRAGEMITICDGEGNAYDCEVLTAKTREVTGRVVRAHRLLGEPATEITLAAGVGKPAIFDWIVEKATELGVRRIVPIRVTESPDGIGGKDAARRRVGRWQRLALGAMKQCLRSRRPAVDEIVDLNAVVNLIQDHQLTLLADPDGPRLDGVFQTTTRIAKVMVVVGPEAGFTDTERQTLVDSGATMFGLGRRRLRAETAAVASLTLLLHHLEEI